jgi:hypothetical protein
MIKHAWTVLAERAKIDRDTNNISLDVLEQVGLTGIIPQENVAGIAAPFQMEVVSLWYRDNDNVPERSRGRVEIHGPRQERLGHTDFDIDLTSFLRLRTKSPLQALPIPMPAVSGRYLFVVLLESNGEFNRVAEVPLQVELQIMVAS